MKSIESRIQLLDCTFRDGGQGIQALHLYGIEGSKFSDTLIKEGIENLRDSGCDIVEVGYVDEFKDPANEVFASYPKMELVSKNIPSPRRDGQKYIALYTGPDVAMEDIPDYNESMVEGIRVILRYSQLEKSLDFCEGLAKKGYKVFVQPMLTMRFSDEELDYVIERTNKMKAYALYFVDSFGYMYKEDVFRLYDYYEKRLDKNIKIGFHAHNNLNQAFSNVQEFVEHAIVTSDHDIIVDSCVLGMGQGAGNLQTELIVPYLNEKYQKEYNYNKILELCEKIEKLTPIPQWGYSVEFALPAVYDAAYKYSLIMRKKLKFSYPEINNVFMNMPADLKHRYTKDNLCTILDNLQIKYDAGNL